MAWGARPAVVGPPREQILPPGTTAPGPVPAGGDEEAPGPARRRRRPGRWPVLVAVLVALTLLLGLLAQRVLSAPAALTRADVDAAVAEAVEKAAADARAAPPDAARAFQVITPSLATVVATGTATATPGATPGGQESLGSGVVISQDGQVLTALHVVKGARSIQVTFADGTRAAATVASSIPEKDIAVLAPQALPEIVVPAVLGGGVGVGDAVFAVGNPFGLTASLSSGVVSGLDRSITPRGGPELGGLIQFDAAVNPGNSGGPLLDRDGQVVGVVTGLANPADQAFFVGVGFAVPIATAAGAAGGGQK